MARFRWERSGLEQAEADASSFEERRRYTNEACLRSEALNWPVLGHPPLSTYLHTIIQCTLTWAVCHDKMVHEHIIQLLT